MLNVLKSNLNLKFHNVSDTGVPKSCAIPALDKVEAGKSKSNSSLVVSTSSVLASVVVHVAGVTKSSLKSSDTPNSCAISLEIPSCVPSDTTTNVIFSVCGSSVNPPVGCSPV